MAEEVIVLTDLTKKYGAFTAVDRICLSVAKGEVFGLLGPNGAGKSTTILMMLGLTEPTSGNVSICGIDATHNPIEVKRRIGYLPEDVGFYDDMTGVENLMYTAALNGIARDEAHSRAVRLMERVGLGEQMEKKAGKYSRGMRQRLGLADVLIKQPQIVILDEPTSGSTRRGAGVHRPHKTAQQRRATDRVVLFAQPGAGAEGLRPRRAFQPGAARGTDRPGGTAARKPRSGRCLQPLFYGRGWAA